MSNIKKSKTNKNDVKQQELFRAADSVKQSMYNKKALSTVSISLEQMNYDVEYMSKTVNGESAVGGEKPNSTVLTASRRVRTRRLVATGTSSTSTPMNVDIEVVFSSGNKAKKTIDSSIAQNCAKVQKKELAPDTGKLEMIQEAMSSSTKNDIKEIFVDSQISDQKSVKTNKRIASAAERKMFQTDRFIIQRENVLQNPASPCSTVLESISKDGIATDTNSETINISRNDNIDLMLPKDADVMLQQKLHFLTEQQVNSLSNFNVKQPHHILTLSLEQLNSIGINRGAMLEALLKSALGIEVDKAECTNSKCELKMIEKYKENDDDDNDNEDERLVIDENFSSSQEWCEKDNNNTPVGDLKNFEITDLNWNEKELHKQLDEMEKLVLRVKNSKIRIAEKKLQLESILRNLNMIKLEYKKSKATIVNAINNQRCALEAENDITHESQVAIAEDNSPNVSAQMNEVSEPLCSSTNVDTNVTGDIDKMTLRSQNKHVIKPSVTATNFVTDFLTKNMNADQKPTVSTSREKIVAPNEADPSSKQLQESLTVTLNKKHIVGDAADSTTSSPLTKTFSSRDRRKRNVKVNIVDFAKPEKKNGKSEMKRIKFENEKVTTERVAKDISDVKKLKLNASVEDMSKKKQNTSRKVVHYTRKEENNMQVDCGGYKKIIYMKNDASEFKADALNDYKSKDRTDTISPESPCELKIKRVSSDNEMPTNNNTKRNLSHEDYRRNDDNKNNADVDGILSPIIDEIASPTCGLKIHLNDYKFAVEIDGHMTNPPMKYFLHEISVPKSDIYNTDAFVKATLPCTISDPRMAKTKQQQPPPYTQVSQQSLMKLPMHSNDPRCRGNQIQPLPPQQQQQQLHQQTVNMLLYGCLQRSPWYQGLMSTMKIHINQSISELVRALNNFHRQREIDDSLIFDVFKIDCAGELLEIMRNLGIIVDVNGIIVEDKNNSTFLSNRYANSTNLVPMNTSYNFVQSPAQMQTSAGVYDFKTSISPVSMINDQTPIKPSFAVGRRYGDSFKHHSSIHDRLNYKRQYKPHNNYRYANTRSPPPICNEIIDDDEGECWDNDDKSSNSSSINKDKSCSKSPLPSNEIKHFRRHFRGSRSGFQPSYGRYQPYWHRKNY